MTFRLYEVFQGLAVAAVAGLLAPTTSKVYLVRTFSGENFVLMKDWQLTADNGFLKAALPSKCECRSMCTTTASCVAYSFNSSGVCVLNDQLGGMVEDTGGTYEYRAPDCMQGLQDGQYYCIKFGKLNNADCVAACERLGMTLPIVRTKASLDALTEYYPWISLYLSDDRRWLWVDDTELDREALQLSDSEPVVNDGVNTFVIWKGKLDDGNSMNSYQCVCQWQFENIP